MEIPVKIKEAAQYLIDIYGDNVEHLGQYQGAEAFYSASRMTWTPAFRSCTYLKTMN